jgi:hypothetical protein
MENKTLGSVTKDKQYAGRSESASSRNSSPATVPAFSFQEDDMGENYPKIGSRLSEKWDHSFATPDGEDWKLSEMREGRKRTDTLIYIYLAAAMLGAFLILFAFNATKAHAAEIPENLWQGLIAEDVAGGYKGMYAVACVVRNRTERGMNHGLCAMKRKDLSTFCRKQGKKYEVMAKEIVHKVFIENSPDITNGADHYEAVERYGMPKWAKSMKVVARIGEHTYFKQIRRKS